MLYCIILLYYYYYTYIISYLILYSSFPSVLLFHSSPIPSHLPLPISSCSVLFLLPLPISSSLLFPIFHQPHSKYTCRVFHLLIYVPSVSDNLTPHVLSDGNVEWCSFNVCWNPVGVFISGYVLRILVFC